MSSDVPGYEVPEYSEHAGAWSLDSDICFLNHGSFGACPTRVQQRQTELRQQLERNPIDFMLRRLPQLGREALHALASLIGADVDGLAFVTNATTGVNCVLRSYPLQPGDEILVLDHVYAACGNAVDFVASRVGAVVTTVQVPFPLQSVDEYTAAVYDAVGPRTVLALIDHITSPTGMLLPSTSLAQMVTELDKRGVDVLIDGAHAPGQIALDLTAIGAAYYTGNCHKWLCTPKGSAFLSVRQDKRDQVRPLTISHGARVRGAGRFRAEFDWQGTTDPTPWLCIPEAIDVLSGLVDGGLPALQARNRQLALQARELLCTALGTTAATPDSMIASLAAIRLPDGVAPGGAGLSMPPLQARLFDNWGIEVPIVCWPNVDSAYIRISAAAYNAPDQFAYLASALASELDSAPSTAPTTAS